MRVLFWFRNDLRLHDNTGLHEAVRDSAGEVIPFALPDDDGSAPERERFRLESLGALDEALRRLGSRLAVGHGAARAALPRAARAARADAVYWNEEYEPALARRDAAIERALGAIGVRTRRFHDRLLVPPGLVLTRSGGPFVVFGAFRRACEAAPLAAPLPRLARFAPHDLPAWPATSGEPAATRSAAVAPERGMPGGERAARARLRRFAAGAFVRYAAGRDLLAPGANSRLSSDLRAGTLSPRTVVAVLAARATAARGAEAVTARASLASFVSELRWRDFFAHVLHHVPRCATEAFRPGLDRVRWNGRPEHLEAWRAGRTGYPVVDAALRELAVTGFVHNRARMIAASFLVKDLLLDWRAGELHFSQRLVDADLASNNGNWQWVAGTGTDAQPWFRIFHPVLQGERFDPDGAYVKRWVPELARLPARWIHRPWDAPGPELRGARLTLDDSYPARVVVHEEQREKALAMFRAALAGGGRTPLRPRGPRSAGEPSRRSSRPRRPR
jgi:deoxyribodipyrimidine photo-lyase